MDILIAIGVLGGLALAFGLILAVASKVFYVETDPRLEKLYNFRLNRTKLHKDDKILLSWNACTMIALAKAGQVLEEPSYLDAAIRIYDFIESKMVTENDRL